MRSHDQKKQKMVQNTKYCLGCETLRMMNAATVIISKYLHKPLLHQSRVYLMFSKGYYIIRPRQVASRFLVTARTESVKSEVWPLFVLRMRSQFLRPFSRINNENLPTTHVFLRLQPWILFVERAKLTQNRS